MNAPSVLLWRCRRGTKELDLMLERFIHAHWAVLDAHQRRALEALLQREDADLQRWLLYGEEVEVAELAPIVARVRSAFVPG
ncbi:succinate dehydrogenase assembly factor 2 [Ectothiorhodospira mobilis]|uniref:FAD assembly factor SdhE n=1 Tax=Ectothiorhodospira mobilis TaxID=195064 RepID=UPI001EE94600|nr:succinate dehydrogenase assembly factor 2 [Ectothiorhodospira mobilis]MCG5535668.1 succinate dehydrogenase assembly factor 2 [Ectothiorhodospira mobilis]